MDTELLEKFKKNDSKVELFGISFALIGLVLFFLENELNKYFLIPGCLVLIILYIVRFYIPNRLENPFSAMDTFIDKIVNGNLAFAVVGILLTLTGKNGMIFLIASVGSTVILIIAMVYNKMKIGSNFIWGKKYFLRIFCIVGLAFFFFLSLKGLIAFNVLNI